MANNDVSYARKYRPRTINEYIGERVKHMILNRFKDGETPPQVILFYGNSGSGKTSMARLVTKEYLCEDKVDGHACGKCEICKEIEEQYIGLGEEIELIRELDIASDSGKAKIADYIEEAKEPPIYGKYKILILDEVHMATPAAQNMLLKVMEEPPKHLIFLLCTTNPEKLLTTLKGRCQLKVEVKKPSIEDLSARLLYICQQENIKTSKEALRMICKKANRGPRDTINLLEEVAKNNGNMATMAEVERQLGVVNNDLYIEYLNAAREGLDSTLVFIRKMKEQNIECRDFIGGITRFVLDGLNIRVGIGLEDFPIEYVRRIKKLFAMFDEDEIDYMLEVLEHATLSLGDDTTSEMLLINTAIRIGSSKKRCKYDYNKDLSQEERVAEKETDEATRKFSEEKKKKESSMEHIKKSGVDVDKITNVFGNNIKDIEKSQVGSIASLVDSCKKEEGSNNATKDKLMSLLGFTEGEINR